MSAMTLRSVEIPPPDAPREWPFMSWHARKRWLRHQAAAVRVAASASPDVNLAPPAPDPAQPAANRVWTREEMLTGRRAHDRHRRGGPRTTTDEEDAYRAYRRAEQARRAQRPPDNAPIVHQPRERTLVSVLELLKSGRTPEDICRELDMKPNTIVKALERCDRKDLAAPFNRLRYHLQGRS